MTKEQAVKLVESKFWETMSYRERAILQLWEDRLIMPFDVFHEAIEKALGRGVQTLEFGLARDDLKLELLGAKNAATFQEIIDKLPKDKQVIVMETPA